MKLTIEMELHDQPNPEHFQKILGYAVLLDRNASNGLVGKIPARLAENALPTDDPESHAGEADRQPSGRGRGRGRGATAEQAAAAVTEQVAAAAVTEQVAGETVSEQEQPKPNGALPPGVTQSVAAATAQANAEATPLPPGAGSPTPPPGVVPQQPAMPTVPDPAPGDAFTLADVQAVYTAWAKKEGPQAFGWLRSKAWADGTPKPGWLNVNQIPADQYDRVMAELSAV